MEEKKYTTKQLEDMLCDLCENEFDSDSLIVTDFDLYYGGMLITHIYCNKDFTPKICFTNGDMEEDKHAEEINIDRDSQEYHDILYYVWYNI